MKYEQENRINFKRLQGGNRISKAYAKKAILYGNKIEVFDYKKIQVSFKDSRIFHRKNLKTERSQSSINRARNNLFRLIDSNVNRHGKYSAVFVTLTFKENKTDLKPCNQEFKLFIKRLNYRLDTKLKYVTVPEWQKRGAVHYHCVFFNLPFLNKLELESIWGHGFTNIQLVKNSTAMAGYLAKYFSKACSDPRLYGQRAYMTSRGLFRPIEVYGGHEVDNVTESATIKKEIVQEFKTYQHTKIITQKYADTNK